jgi:methyl-accepting chemotaxis protein
MNFCRFSPNYNVYEEMIMPLFDILLNHGSLGIFAAFLIWLYTNMQKRMDELVDKFQGQLEEIRKDQKADQEALRVRYDDVIGKYDTERKQTRLQIKDRIEKVGGVTQKIDQRTSNILVRLESNTDEVGSIDKRIEIMVDHIKIMSDLLKQMEQEQRVRNLVKMAHGETTIPPK